MRPRINLHRLQKWLTPLLLLSLHPLLLAQQTETWLAKIEAETDSSRKIDLYIDMGKSLLSQPDTVILYAKEGIEFARSVANPAGEAHLNNLIGVAYWQKQDFTEAIKYYEKAIAFLKEGKDDEEIAKISGNIGVAYMVLGDFTSALPFLERTYTLRKQLSLETEAARTAVNLGYTHHNLGNFQQAIAFQLESARMADRLEDAAWLASSYVNIGNIYFEIEDISKAKDYYQQAHEYLLSLGDQNAMAECIGSLANIALKEGAFQQALEQFKQVENLATKTGNQLILANAYNGSGNASMELEAYPEAIASFEKAYALNEKIGNRFANATVAQSLSELYLHVSNRQETVLSGNETLSKAVRYAREALSISEESAAKPRVEKTMLHLIKVLKIKGEWQHAFEYQERLSGLRDELLNAQKHEQLAEMESKYQLESKTRRIEALQASQRIQELEIAEQRNRVRAQRLLILIIVGSFTAAGVGVFLFWKWKTTQQQNLENKLIIQNLQTEQKLFRSQMNPHFIYNSLNSIQAFISSNDAYQAETYLARFAKLMRGILENSRQDRISFEREIAVVEAYLDLEKLRFSNRFDYSIELSDDFDESEISLPPMLIQPFLENAILHGFKGVTHGLLKLSFEDTGDLLICEIDDNGVGRSETRKPAGSTGKQSLATSITHERLATLSRQTGKPASLEIIDKKDAQNRPTGTKVVIKIPIE
jgi:tetratricopeptide (TPR) repeat protein